MSCVVLFREKVMRQCWNEKFFNEKLDFIVPFIKFGP
jgi:hypothetical protein